MARYFAALLATSGVVSALVHPLPNLTDMTALHRFLITAVCVLGGIAIWVAPWDRWPRRALLLIPPIGFGVKLWANLLGGLGPYSYSIHFVLIYVWMGVALPRWTPLAFAPMLAVAYSLPLMVRGDPRQSASVALVLPICVVIGESVAWISNRLREVEQVDGQRMQRMRWLLEASADLAHLRTSAETAERVAQLATEIPGGLAAAVLLPRERGVLEVVASCGWPGTLPDCLSINETPALIEANQAHTALTQDHESCRQLADQLGLPRLGVVPLWGSSRCVGVALVVRQPGATPLDTFAQDLIQTLSVQAGLALERVRDRQLLLDESLHDELTGLGNRRKANARLETLEPGDALLSFDLDHFKRVNDTFGHAAGDAVLRDLGSFLSASLREHDEAFRMGGEEFLVVLEQSEEGARVAGERLCEGWRQREPVTTLSGGIAVHVADRTPSATLERSDTALYEAKRGGRDRVVFDA